MPYYIYNVYPDKQLEKVAEFPAFREASTEAKRLRKEIPLAGLYKVKVIFAENESLAAGLLMQEREPEPLTGDDW